MTLYWCEKFASFRDFFAKTPKSNFSGWISGKGVIIAENPINDFSFPNLEKSADTANKGAVRAFLLAHNRTA